MSDDTTDRMDRAKRIRRMREGQRAAAEESADDASAAEDERAAEERAAEERTDKERTADEAGAAGDEPADEPATDSSVDDGAADDADETNADGDDTADDGAADADSSDGDTMDADASDDATDDSDGQDAQADQDESGSADELEREARAAAQRAAQNAAQVTGEGVAQVAAAADSDGPGGVDAGASGGTGPVMPQGPTGVELPDEATIQSAIADEVLESSEGVGTGTARAGVVEERAASQEETVRVLEFTLGTEHYCLDITHVEEIVKRESITRVPNTPEYVEGVVDLRGQITTILDPKVLLGIDEDGSESLLVVFDPDGFEDQGAIGWVVDAVRQVVPVAESEISDPPVDDEHIQGVVDRDDEDEFVIWTDPELAIRLATAEGDDN